MKNFGVAALILLVIVMTVNAIGERKDEPKKPSRFLFYMPLISKSMKITFIPLADQLADRGHQVVVVMPYEAKAADRLDIITIHSPYDEITKNISKKMLSGGNSHTAYHIFDVMQGAVDANDNALGNQRLRKHIEEGFDVVIVNSFFCSEAGYYLAKRSDAALVLYLSGQVSISNLDWAVGQPHNTAYLPFPMVDFQHPFTFLQRIVNTLGTYIYHMFRDFVVIPKGEALLDKHFPGEKRMSLLDIERNTSLVLHYGHPMIMDGLRPLSPNFQYIGMMNCKEAQPLPKDLAGFIDSGKEHGVIFVSFGTVLQARTMNKDKLDMFIKVFGSLKQNIIWKWEDEEMPNKPDNVRLYKWLPQQDILGHPNTNLFITHAGQSSIQETLCYQKPVVAIPLAADQPANAKEAVRVGFGVQVGYKDMTEESLLHSIQEVLNNPIYTEVAQQHGSLLNDQITRPMERAVWWLEFLTRHKGKNHMRSPVHDLTWYQYLLLDVILFLAAVASLLVLIIYKLCRLCLCRKKPKKD